MEDLIRHFNTHTFNFAPGWRMIPYNGRFVYMFTTSAGPEHARLYDEKYNPIYYDSYLKRKIVPSDESRYWHNMLYKQVPWYNYLNHCMC
ncbi:MAG: hypothetical protein KDH96_11575 [Candidatus Riesia sp.]|nr:hypothetical protein [Candidatus Riesia sp.]